MRRFIVGGVITLAIVLGTAVPSGAVPTNGVTFVFTCGDASITIGTTPGGGAVSWGTDGAMYLLKSDEFRAYRGEFATEPTELAPFEEFSKSYGNRTGQGEAMACARRGYNPDHNATGFEHITVTRKS
jgi:hypothetical protein